MESTGESYVTSTPTTRLENLVRSLSKVGDTSGLVALLRWILVFDPPRRPDVSDLLNHPWFAGSLDLAAVSVPGLEGISPPSVSTTDEPKPANADQENPTTIPAAASMELSNKELEPSPVPYKPSPLPPKPLTTAGTRPIPPTTMEVLSQAMDNLEISTTSFCSDFVCRSWT